MEHETIKEQDQNYISPPPFHPNYCTAFGEGSWISSSAQGPAAAAGPGEPPMDQCVCFYTWPENNRPRPPECSADRLHTPGASLQNANFQTLVFFNECTGL